MLYNQPFMSLSDKKKIYCVDTRQQWYSNGLMIKYRRCGGLLFPWVVGEKTKMMLVRYCTFDGFMSPLLSLSAQGSTTRASSEEKKNYLRFSIYRYH